MKKFASILLAGTLLFTTTGEFKTHKFAEAKEEIEIEIPYNVVNAIPINFDEDEFDNILQEVEQKYSAFYIVNTPLNKRMTPSTEFEPVGYLAKGQPVEGVDLLDNGWVELKDGSFVNGKYLNEQTGMTLEEYNYKVAEFEQFVEQQRLAREAEKKRQRELAAKQAAEQALKAKQAAQSQASTQQKQVQQVSTSTQTTSTGRSGISLSSSERDLLARLVRAEAGGESYEGMVAVASVVLNRVLSPKFPNTVTDVIYAKNQFSPVSNGSINKAASEIHYKAVDDALRRDNTNGATFFYAPSIVKSSYMESLKTVAVIGAHHFKVN